jgi:hypothetical protein
MTTDKVAPPAPAPPPQQKTDADLNTLCEKIRREASLTPPAHIDALCNNEPLPWICLEALFVDELRSIAHMLGRSHLLRLVKCESE